MHAIKYWSMDIIMIILVALSFDFIHSVILAFAISIGLVINITKFIYYIQDRKLHNKWEVEDRAKYDRWKNPSHYHDKKKK